jgi:hypothetical protein
MVRVTCADCEADIPESNEEHTIISFVDGEMVERSVCEGCFQGTIDRQMAKLKEEVN